LSSRRTALTAFAAVLVLGVLFLLAVSLSITSNTTQTLGVLPVYPVAPLEPHGGIACEEPIAVAEPIETISFNVGTWGLPGPPIAVTVEEWGGGPLAEGRVAAGWVDDGTPQVVPLGRVAAGQYIRVCFRNEGEVRASVWGDLGTGAVGTKLSKEPRPTITPASASVNGIPITADMSMNFVSSEQHSLLSQLPEVMERAALFRPAFVGGWTFWLLVVALVIVVPLALWRAFARASQDAPPPHPEPPIDTGSHPAVAARLAAPSQRGDAAGATRGSTD
jgi:hypothetical protein